MHDLKTMTSFALDKLMGGKTPLPAPRSSRSSTFNTAWQIYLAHLQDNPVKPLTQWAAAKRDVSWHIDRDRVSPEYVRAETGYVAASYVQCAHLAMVQTTKAFSGKVSKAEVDETMQLITDFVKIIVKKTNDMQRYTRDRAKQISRDTDIFYSINEFYSLAATTLHHTRDFVTDDFHPTLDKALDTCMEQLNRFGIFPIIPAHTVQSIKNAAKFKEALDGQCEQQSRAQPQLLLTQSPPLLPAIQRPSPSALLRTLP